MKPHQVESVNRFLTFMQRNHPNQSFIIFFTNASVSNEMWVTASFVLDSLEGYEVLRNSLPWDKAPSAEGMSLISHIRYEGVSLGVCVEFSVPYTSQFADNALRDAIQELKTSK